VIEDDGTMYHADERRRRPVCTAGLRDGCLMMYPAGGTVFVHSEELAGGWGVGWWGGAAVVALEEEDAGVTMYQMW